MKEHVTVSKRVVFIKSYLIVGSKNLHHLLWYSMDAEKILKATILFKMKLIK
jgi:hypothetical protein